MQRKEERKTTAEGKKSGEGGERWQNTAFYDKKVQEMHKYK